MSLLLNIQTRARIRIPLPTDVVYKITTRADAPALLFKGWGPIPGTTSSVVLGDGGLKEGSLRRITGTDGSVIDEEVTVLVPGKQQSYRLPPGSFKGGFGALVKEAHGNWEYTDQGDSTLVNWTFTFVLTSPLAWPLALPLSMAFQKAMEAALKRIEAHAKCSDCVDEEQIGLS